MIIAGLMGYISFLRVYDFTHAIKIGKNPCNPYYRHLFTSVKLIAGLYISNILQDNRRDFLMLDTPKKGENARQFWQRQNKQDNAIGLYCQSCCYRYPDECLFMDTLHPLDRSAETCPDFVPKDMYKGKSRAKCWRKRLQVEPDYMPLPDNLIWHPYYFPALCNSTEYFMIMTKEKVYRKLEVK